jgi:predicted nuclease with TOPRIM domain
MASIAEVTQAVSSIATEEIAKMGGSIEDATTQVTQLTVKWENFKAIAGKNLSENVSGIGKLTESFLDLGMAAQFYIEAGTAASKLVFFGGREESSGSFKNAIADVNQAIHEQQWFINDLRKFYEKLNPPVTKTITTLGGLKEKLAELQKEYEETDVASPRFAQLRKEIEKLDNQLKKLTKPEVLKQVVFYSEAAAEYLRDINEELFKGTDYWITYGDRMAEALDPSALENFAITWQETEHEFIPGIRNLSKEFETLNSLIDITANTLGNSLQQSLSSVFNLAVLKQELKGLQEEFQNMDTSNLRFNELSQEIERLQEQISSIDGDFFKTLIDSLKKMAIQLAATAGAALALSVILKSLGIGGGATIGQIFKVVGGQMGLPGLSGSSFNPLTGNVEGGLFGGRTTLRGNDIFLANSRSGYDLGRIGG